MSIKTEDNTKIDIVKWGLVGVLFAAGLYANYHYQAVIALPLRMIGWIVLFSAMLGIACWTSKGKVALSFARESRIELRKVVWPTRQETVQTTILVMVLVLVMGLVLWLLDTGLLWLVSWLTGQRG